MKTKHLAHFTQIADQITFSLNLSALVWSTAVYSPSAPRLNVLCAQRPSSLVASVVAQGYFIVTFISSNQSGYSPLTSAIIDKTFATHWIFSLFETILCKPQRWLCVKIPVDQQFLKYSDQPVCQPCHVQSHSNHLSFPF